MTKFWLEVETDDDSDSSTAELVWNAIDAVYHTPGIKTVVKCHNNFPTPPAVEEQTRRPDGDDRIRAERAAGPATTYHVTCHACAQQYTETRDSGPPPAECGACGSFDTTVIISVRGR